MEYLVKVETYVCNNIVCISKLQYFVFCFIYVCVRLLPMCTNKSVLLRVACLGRRGEGRRLGLEIPRALRQTKTFLAWMAGSAPACVHPWHAGAWRMSGCSRLWPQVRDHLPRFRISRLWNHVSPPADICRAQESGSSTSHGCHIF